MNILIIEDDQIDLMAYQRAIGKTDYSDSHIVNATNADQAFELMHELEFDCIFLDYMLPGQNGLELLNRVREKGYNMPVAVVTSQGDQRLAVEMMKAGAFDYFTKGEINPELLGKLLHNVQQVNQLTAERNLAEKRLKEQERFINKIASFSPNIIYVFDLEHKKTIFINHDLFKMLGYGPNDLPKSFEKAFNRLIDPQEYEDFKRFVNRLALLSEEEVDEAEMKLIGADGNYNWMFTRNVSFKRNEQGVTTQVLGTAVNISNRKKEEEELLIAKQQAEHAATAKSEFLSNMSHEIRTPMNAIIGLSDLLLSRDFKGEDLENLKAIKNSADNLLVIINDILDFSKIEAGKLNFESIAFSLRERLDHVIKTMNFKAEQKNIYLKLSLSKDLPSHLIGDPFRLNQILVNLVGNAVKFTSEGGVTIQVSSQSKEEDGTENITFEVIDTGIGVPEEKQASIFESFSQAYTDVTRHYGGTGLGLTITKRLVELQGGNLGLESEKDKGSNFHFTLPFQITQCEDKDHIKVLNHEDLKDSLSGVNILVAEDNPVNQMLIQQVLSKWDVTFTICNNGQEAVDVINQQTFNIILMDLQMPVLDGISATHKIRQSEGVNQDIPIIALTADAFVETRKRVINEGFNDYLTKPFKKEDLLEKISKHVS